MALLEHADRAVEDGSWSSVEIEEAAALCDAADADSARWALGDWLAEHVPVGEVRGRKTGSLARLAELAEHVGWSAVHLRGLRDTAHAWPPATRVPCAPYYVHDGFRDGGPERAAWRREQLLTMERGARGRVTQTALRRWRDEQAEPDVAATRRRARIVESAPPELADVLCRIDALLGDVDRLARVEAIELWPRVRAHLDALMADVELIAVALMKPAA